MGTSVHHTNISLRKNHVLLEVFAEFEKCLGFEKKWCSVNLAFKNDSEELPDSLMLQLKAFL